MKIDTDVRRTIIRAVPFGLTVFLGLFMKNEYLTIKQFIVISMVHILTGSTMWILSKQEYKYNMVKRLRNSISNVLDNHKDK